MTKNKQKHRTVLKKKKSRRNCEKLEEIKSVLNEKTTRRAHKVSIKVGASSWLPILLLKRYVSCRTNSHSGTAYTSDTIFHSNEYHNFVFVAVHSGLNMLIHVQMVDLRQSDITKLETLELSLYLNTAEI